MKISLFLSVVSVFTVFHLCKAGPLRHLQKRAAFYIANETACVVDNIVYSSGDPIPTDDPCEACKCRPPGFACVLKECKIKPGCRAVRHAGQCCPEYICGCEHNGRFYKDGDEIKDPKNPCYQCYCQGSSIACAFVDCIYRDECDSVFVPGECCPQYTNCTRDIPDRNLFLGGNPLPPANLWHPFNDQSFLPEVPSTDQAIELSEDPTNPIQPEVPDEKAPSSESAESVDVSSEAVTTEPESVVTEAKNLNTVVGEKETEALESSEEVKEDIPKENESKEDVVPPEETSLSLNSESNLHKDDVAESLKAQDLELSTEVEKESPQTTTVSKLETVDEAEVTEKPTETKSTTTEITVKDTEIKNSASENGKSLKLSDNDHLEEIEKEKPDIKSDLKPNEKETTELVPEPTSAVPTDALKESSTVESKSESEENAAEESQRNAQATSFNINNAKIKSESAETVTIIVHVKESSEIPTEIDFVPETLTQSPMTSVSEENLLKSNDEIVSPNSNKETSELVDNKSTNANFETFPTTKQISETELTSKAPPTDKISEDIQGKSDEADNIALEAEENPVSKENVSDLKNEDDSSAPIATVDITKVDNEVRSNEEIAEETEVDEPTKTVIRIDSSKPITIEIITDSASSPKPEKSTTELEKQKTEESTEELKIEKTEEPTEVPKIEKTEELRMNLKNEKIEEIVEEAVPERKEVLATSEEKKEDTTPVQSGEEAMKEKEETTQADELVSTTEKVRPEEKIEESTPKNIEEKPEIRTNDEVDNEKSTEKTNNESIEKKTTKEVKSETTTESQNQAIEESKQTTLSDSQ